MKIEIGDELIISHDIVDITGNIIFKKNQKVIIKDIEKIKSKWSNVFNMYTKEEILGVILEGYYGIWMLSCFEN